VARLRLPAPWRGYPAGKPLSGDPVTRHRHSGTVTQVPAAS